MIGSIERYIIKKIIGCFFIVSLVFLNIVNLFEFVELLRRSAGKEHVEIITLIEMILLKMPFNWQHFLIFLFFFGSLLAFWILSQNQEMIAFQACGFSPFHFMRSIFLSSLTIFLLFLVIIDPLSCALRARYVDLDNKTFDAQTSLSVVGASLWLRDNDPLTLFHAQKFHLEKSMFWNVRLFDFSKDVYQRYYFAKHARLLPGKWELNDVTCWHKNGKQEKMKKVIKPTHFSIEKIERVKRPPELVPFLQMKDYQKTLEKHGFSTLKYQLYWHRFLAQFVLMMALGGFSMIVCMQSLRHHRNIKLIGSSIGICFALHFFQDLLQALSLAQKISIPLACWGGASFLMFMNIAWLMYKNRFEYTRYFK